MLRRLSTNVVDVLTPEGQYVDALGSAHGPIVGRVAQVRFDLLTIAIESETGCSEFPRVGLLSVFTAYRI